MYEEEEINLWMMLFYGFKRWKIAFVVAIIVAVLVGGYRMTSNIRVLNDEETFTQMKTDYESELLAYEAEGKQLEANIESTNKELVNQKDYIENSVLMKVDAKNEWIGRVNCYIDTKYQIMPGTSIQNENPAYKITSAYYDLASSGNFYNEVLEGITIDISDVKYLKEVLGVSADTNRYALTIAVLATSEEECRDLLKVTTDVLESHKQEIEKQLGEHNFIITTEKPYSQINETREQYQLSQQLLENDLEVEYADLRIQYKEWHEKDGKIAMPVLDYAHAVKNGIKWLIIAGVAAVVVVLGCCCLGYLFTGYVTCGYEAPGHLHLIGMVPKNTTRKLNVIDKIIYTVFGCKLLAKDYTEILDASAIHLVQVWKNADLNSNTNSIAVASDISEEKLKALVEEMQKTVGQNCELVHAGNVLLSAEASKKVEAASSVVLVVEQNTSLKKNVEKMIDQFNAYGKKILGIIITNVDAM